MTYVDRQDAVAEKGFIEWRDVIACAIPVLKQMAGTTETEFLQIGSRLQSLYQQSGDISVLAGQLVTVVSGDSLAGLTQRLQEMMADMESYLSHARIRSSESCQTLELVENLLNNLSEPLEGFHKMNKTLRMLSISTKIESSRLGEAGNGFANLAMDVEKLSHQVSEKSLAILGHRQLLATMISDNLVDVHASEVRQDEQVRSTLQATAANLKSLETINSRCGELGEMVAQISADVTASISDVVSSMQMHDMTRQQFEHVIEALERLDGTLQEGGAVTGDDFRKLVIEAGDVCELQEAQLRFASGELYSAVCTIIDRLRDIAGKQSVIVHSTAEVTGSGSGGASFVDEMRQGMEVVTTVLAECARSGSAMAAVMRKVAETINEIAAFVTDIEAIGSEIDLIAMNSQIKAALTGAEGAALGVLAEAIKRLSDEAVRQTNLVAGTLTDIHAATEHLLADSASGESELGETIDKMQVELATIMQTMGTISQQVTAVMANLNHQVFALSQDVDSITESVDVHQRTRQLSDNVLHELSRVVAESRQIEPASSQFKENLRHMEEHYTMESERHIHEALARKRSGQVGTAVITTAKSGNDSEFGDNVDLF